MKYNQKLFEAWKAWYSENYTTHIPMYKGEISNLDQRLSFASWCEALKSIEKPAAWYCCIPGQDPVLSLEEPSDDRYPQECKTPLYFIPDYN